MYNLEHDTMCDLEQDTTYDLEHDTMYDLNKIKYSQSCLCLQIPQLC
jgi:hypothetical protein